MLSPTAKRVWTEAGGCAMAAPSAVFFTALVTPVGPRSLRSSTLTIRWSFIVANNLINFPINEFCEVQLDQHRVHNLVAQSNLMYSWKQNKEMGQLMLWLLALKMWRVMLK
jgi:hypothetical protein